MTTLDFLLTQKCTFYGGQSKEHSSQVSYVKLCASLVAILDFKSTQKCDQQIKHKFEQFQIFLPYTYYITYMISLEEI